MCSVCKPFKMTFSLFLCCITCATDKGQKKERPGNFFRSMTRTAAFTPCLSRQVVFSWRYRPEFMTKKDIIDRMALKAGISKAAAERAVNAFLDRTRQELEKGNKVRLRGFGGFSVKKSAATRCRHPQTGELIEVAAQGRVRFLPSKNLKNALDTKEDTARR